MMLSDVKIIADNLEDFIEVPDGIERLRKAVLILAISGKLVPQDPSEGRADELFLDIQTCLTDSAAIAKRTKKAETLPPITPEEIPFEIPESWKWVRLGEIYRINPRNTAEEDLQVSFLPMPRIHASWSQPIDLKETRAWKEVKSGFTHIAEGDVLLAKITPCFENGKSSVARGLTGGLAAGTTELHVFRDLSKQLNPDYLLCLLKTDSFLHDGERHMTGSAGQKRVPTDYVARHLIALPPASEQKRIVDKVNELMSQLNILEIKKNERDDTRKRLIKNAMYSLGVGDVAIALQDIIKLVKTLSDLKELEKGILTLAVSGRLVPQKPSSESVDSLVEQIRNEKTMRQVSNNPRKKKIALRTSDDVLPFEIPNSWKWVKLDDIGTTNIGLTYSPDDTSKTEGIPVLRSSNIQNGQIDLNDLVRVKKEVKDSVLANEGDLLICARNGSRSLVGKTAMIRGLNEKMAFGAFMAIFRSRCNAYVEIFLKSPIYRDSLEGVSTTTINQITQENLKNTSIPLPPMEEQDRIVKKVEEIMELLRPLSTILSK